jgi:hypothetical protein
MERNRPAKFPVVRLFFRFLQRIQSASRLIDCVEKDLE